MKILVVDDEKTIVKGIKFNLENEGYQVDVCYDGETAVDMARHGEYAVILLDLMMPKLDGLGACQQIRQFSTVPIIMLTARSEDADKLIGFESGADDYITKPFNILELKARIRALIRRSSMAPAAPAEPDSGNVFMDADDLFTPECFSAYDRYVDSDYDIIFSLSQGVYSNDITKLNDRGDIYSDLVMNFLEIGEEKGLRVDYPVPWGKMVKASLVRGNDILFDEVPAGNDVMFGLKVGFAAKKIAAIPIVTYMVTASTGSITRTMSLENLESRLYVKKRYNRMLKEHGYKKTASQMYLIVASAKYGIKPFFKFLFTALKDGDLFIGWKHWIITVFKMHTKPARSM